MVEGEFGDSVIRIKVIGAGIWAGVIVVLVAPAVAILLFPPGAIAAPLAVSLLGIAATVAAARLIKAGGSETVEKLREQAGRVGASSFGAAEQPARRRTARQLPSANRYAARAMGFSPEAAPLDLACRAAPPGGRWEEPGLDRALDVHRSARKPLACRKLHRICQRDSRHQCGTDPENDEGPAEAGPVEVTEMTRLRKRGLEPPRVLPHRNLNPARLPVPPLPRAYRKRR